MSDAKSPIRIEMYTISNPQSFDYMHALHKPSIDGYELSELTTSEQLNDYTGLVDKDYLLTAIEPIPVDDIHTMTGV